MAGLRTRRLAGCTLLISAAALLAACNATNPSASSGLPSAAEPSSVGPSVSATPSPTPESRSPIAAAGCTWGQLAISVVIAPGRHAAGSTYFPVVFINTSGTPCTMFDPIVAFVATQGGRRIGPEMSAGIEPAATVELAPGDAAHTVMQVSNADLYDPSTCRPVSAVTVRWLRITWHGQTVPVYAPFTPEGRVCSAGGQVNIDPIAPGAWPPPGVMN